MLRLIFMAFGGEAKFDKKKEKPVRLHWSLSAPLLVLSLLCVAAIFSGTVSGGLLGEADAIAPQLTQWPLHLLELSPRAETSPTLALSLSLTVVGLGLLLGYFFYGTKSSRAEKIWRAWPAFMRRAFETSLGFDLLYDKILVGGIVLPLSRFAKLFDDVAIDRVLVDGWQKIAMAIRKAVTVFDDVVIDGLLVDGIGGGVPELFGSSLRALQNGKVQSYLMAGIVALVALLFLGGLL
jgi:NADH:ubiquinone oxidoreductase subunit 5 (subunit L)/multisubunit Na+/H+ antiporter MnhA subunit